jgi:hypothetical protein
MSEASVRGHCLCGAVSLEVGALGARVGACHCDICRTWGGGPLLALDAGSEVRLAGADRIAIYASTAWAERGFCSVCGSHLFIRVKQSGRYIVPVGLFPESGELRFDHQIFIDRKPAYYCFANETRNLTGAEVFAQHPPSA